MSEQVKSNEQLQAEDDKKLIPFIKAIRDAIITHRPSGIRALEDQTTALVEETAIMVAYCAMQNEAICFSKTGQTARHVSEIEEKIIEFFKQRIKSEVGRMYENLIEHPEFANMSNPLHTSSHNEQVAEEILANIEGRS